MQPSPVDVVIATRSTGKLRELLPLLSLAGLVPRTLDDVALPVAPVEDTLEVFDTFEANALAKARYFAARLPGVLVLADDSGLEVAALGGAPGVRSKRWSGRDELTGTALDAANNALLLASLERVGARMPADRRARYVCAMAAVRAGPSAAQGHMASTGAVIDVVATGACEGRILEHPVGGGGFGYDPLFWSQELEASMASVSRDEKARVSHRGRALRALLGELTRLRTAG